MVFSDQCTVSFSCYSGLMLWLPATCKLLDVSKYFMFELFSATIIIMNVFISDISITIIEIHNWNECIQLIEILIEIFQTTEIEL